MDRGAFIPQGGQVSAFCHGGRYGSIRWNSWRRHRRRALSLVKDYIEKRASRASSRNLSGFGQQAKSWCPPINAEQIQQALGSEKVREMAAKFGIPVDKVADLLAKHLPTAIDKATPEGKLPS
jgi:YidB-like protein